MAGMPVDWKGSDGKARSEVVAFLKARGGEISHADGLAVVEMQDSLGRSRSLSNLLRTMEHDGMIEREVRGRRTYRIKLVDDWGMARDTPVGTVTPIRPGVTAASLDGQVDYDLLGESLLAIVLRKMSEPAPAKPDKSVVDRLRRAELTIRKQDEQLQAVDAERTALRDRVGELEEQARIYEHNMTLLKAEMDKPKTRRGGGTPLAERLSADERGMLAELMRSLPETPQSKPRRTR
jgi:hypothetical protein